ncbi:MAG: transcription termination factor Rho [Ndongobacter sp.]|nr:transcription termination factor Rho [Ndongobacter sp.]
MTAIDSSWSVMQLREYAKAHGLKSSYKYKKHELLAWLAEQGGMAQEEDAAEEGLCASATGVADSKTSSVASEPESASDRGEAACEKASVLPEREEEAEEEKKELRTLPSVTGRLEVMADGYGFLRAKNGGETADYYVPHVHIRRYRLRSGDIVDGIAGDRHDKERYAPIIYINSINGASPAASRRRLSFDDLTPIYPNQRIRLERVGEDVSNRIVDLVAPIGRGQRGLIVSPPKAGKTTLLKAIAQSVEQKYPEINLFVLLIDERPEEVTDFQRSVNQFRADDDLVKTEIVASTFDKDASSHTQTAEALLERAKRMVEGGQDVMILLDSITRLSRAYNITTQSSGKTLSGGLDPVAMYPPKRFFGAARNIDGDGSLTILATCLRDTGSRMDEMIYEEFKGTGNMEVHLSRDLSELRIFPAIDIFASGTRREDLLLDADEQKAMVQVRRQARQRKEAEAVEQFVQLIKNTPDNESLCRLILDPSGRTAPKKERG